MIARIAVHVAGKLHDLLKREPLFQLDADGIEYAGGRFFWKDIECVQLVGASCSDEGGSAISKWLLLSLRTGASPRPPRSNYYSGFSPVPTETPEAGIEVPLSVREGDVLAAMSRFFDGPIDVGLSNPSRSSVRPPRAPSLRSAGGSPVRQETDLDARNESPDCVAWGMIIHRARQKGVAIAEQRAAQSTNCRSTGRPASGFTAPPWSMSSWVIAQI